MHEFDCFFLKPNNFSLKMHFLDTREAIEVVKNYLDDDKKGMSCSCITVYDNSKNVNDDNYKIYDKNNDNNNNSIPFLKILKSTMIKKKMMITAKKEV